MRTLYDRKCATQEKEEIKVKTRKADFKKDKVAKSAKKLQEKEDEMDLSDSSSR
jgi:hypothetical protein